PKPGCPLEWSKSRIQSRPWMPRDRKKISISPQTLRPSRNRFARHLPLHLRIVIFHFIRPKALLADVNRRHRHPMPAFLAFEAQNVTHVFSKQTNKKASSKKRL